MNGDAIDTIDPADPQQAAACRRLWCAVLLAALADAERGDAQARAWFRSRDFRLIASLAGLDDDTALERITAMHGPTGP